MQWLKNISVVGVMVFTSLSMAEVTPWELEAHDEDKDIKVFTRSVGDSPLKEFKGVTNIKADVSDFVALLKDSDVATSWMHNVIDFQVMENPSDTVNVVYTVNETPWPVTDRDAYVRSVMTADENGAVTSALTAVPAYKEENEDFIRMPELKGAWVFTPKEEGIVEVVYQVHANPGGSLPNWLVNAIVVETPMETLINLHEIIQEDKYKGKTYAFIENAKKTVAAAEEVTAEVAEVAAE